MIEQREKHANWIQNEGGVERPTHLETLKQPEQIKRINWLKRKCADNTHILDIGCNWGYVLNEIGGDTGVDINPENIHKAQREFPDKKFLVQDATKKLPFKDREFSIVVMADVLEHLNWIYDVWLALAEALRVCHLKLLITLPWRKDDKCALCFKHEWVPDETKIGYLVMALTKVCWKVEVESDGDFVYLEVWNGRKVLQ